MNPTNTARCETAATIEELASCRSCHGPLRSGPHCPDCVGAYRFQDGIMEAIGILSGRNQVAASFYDGPGWVKFRPWEQAFLFMVGGVRKARMEILRHVLERVKAPRALALEVGIGSGENLDCVPRGWTVQGVDIARTQLLECIRRHPTMSGRLAWAEAEKLPFADETFDACWSVGGFNYYRDHEASLREMRRVTKPGGPVVVADEIPNLHRAGLGHLIGVPSLDGWWLRRLGLDREFVRMVLDFDIDVRSLQESVWPNAVQHRIWRGLGYCLVDPSTP